MRKPSTRKITSPAKPVPATAAKPVSNVALNTATPLPTGTALATTAPIARPSRAGINKTAAGIVAKTGRLPGSFSDRDSDYLAFFATFARVAGNKPVTLADIVASGRKPDATLSKAVSLKPTDRDAISRLRHHGMLDPSADGLAFTLTDAARKHAAYNAAK